MNSARILKGIAIGVVVAFVAVPLAVISGGVGHGNYVFAKLFFPYSVILSELSDKGTTIPLIVVALIQYPLYSGIIAATTSPSNSSPVVGPASIALVHLVALILRLTGFLPRIS